MKKRIARMGGGKSSGYRTMIAHRSGDRAIFLHLFAKNEKANVNPRELAALRALAKAYMAKTAAELEKAISIQALSEIR